MLPLNKWLLIIGISLFLVLPVVIEPLANIFPAWTLIIVFFSMVFIIPGVYDSYMMNYANVRKMSGNSLSILHCAWTISHMNCYPQTKSERDRLDFMGNIKDIRKGQMRLLSIERELLKRWKADSEFRNSTDLKKLTLELGSSGDTIHNY